MNLMRSGLRLRERRLQGTKPTVESAFYAIFAQVHNTLKSRLKASLSAEQIVEWRDRAASPRDHVDGCVPGGRSENGQPSS
jgi:hypothetical protein